MAYNKKININTYIPQYPILTTQWNTISIYLRNVQPYIKVYGK